MPRDLAGEMVPLTEYMGRITPANSQCVVLCWFILDTDKRHDEQLCLFTETQHFGTSATAQGKESLPSY